MIKCTGAHCPLQYNPEKPLNPMECQAADTCPNATPITDEQLNYISMVLTVMSKQILEDAQKIKNKLTAESMPFKPSKPINMSDYPKNCCCNNDNYGEGSDKYAEDCYFYYEEQHMGAHIPCCSKTGEMEPNGCNKKCKYYILEETALRIISDYRSLKEYE